MTRESRQATAVLPLCTTAVLVADAHFACHGACRLASWPADSGGCTQLQLAALVPLPPATKTTAVRPRLASQSGDLPLPPRPPLSSERVCATRAAAPPRSRKPHCLPACRPIRRPPLPTCPKTPTATPHPPPPPPAVPTPPHPSLLWVARCQRRTTCLCSVGGLGGREGWHTEPCQAAAWRSPPATAATKAPLPPHSTSRGHLPR